MSLTRRFKNRNLSIIVTIIMIMAMFPSIAFAASATDIANHWAKVQVGDWMDKGLVNGYPDGTFKPDNNITRAEFMVIVNGAFGYKEKATVDYKDVTADAWYADAVAKAKAAGYFTGYADGTAKPDSPISRQETAVVIMKVKGLTQNESAAAKFTDAAGISQWSKGAIGATVTAGFMNGYPDGSFKANNPITRAEAVVALSKAMNKPAPTPEIPADDSKVYDQAGTYGPATGSVTVNGNVTIKAKDVILQNTIIEGDLTIDKAVGDGNVTLKKVVVKGNTYINGGGTNSVYLIDTQTGKTYVIKDSGPVRIVASGTSDINQLIAQSSVKVEETDLTGKGFEGIIVDKKVDGKIEINLVNAKVENFQVKSEGVTVNTDNNTTISTLVADAKVDVTGKGTVQHATINASGVTFETKPTTQTVASGVKEPTVNKSSSGGGGGGGSSTVAVSAISVAPTTMTLTVGATGTITATVSPDNASNKKVNWTTSDSNVATVDANGKVSAVAVGTATITATSAANSSKKANCVVTVEAAPEAPVAANFVSTGNVGIAPESAGDAAGKIYAEYKLVAGEEDISLAASNIGEEGYIKVKIGDGTWEDLTANTDATLWFNVEAETGLRTFEVKTTDGKIYTATLDWKEEINNVSFTATGREGTRPGTEDTYVEYEIKVNEERVSLAEGAVKLIAQQVGEKWVELEPNTDQTLWFKKDKATGNYNFFVVTKDGVMYKAKLDWTKPGEEPIELDSTIAKDAGTGGTGTTATVDGKTITFSGNIDWYPADDTLGRTEGNRVGVKITAPTTVTLGEATTLTFNQTTGEDKTITGWDRFKDGDNYFYFYPLVKEAGQTTTLVIKWDGTDATADTFTIKIAEGTTLVAAPAEPDPEVSGSITRGDSTGGADLVYTEVGDTVTFTEGEIKWYEKDESVGRNVDGNWVGVKITAPEGFTAEDLSNVDVKIGDSTYKWSEIQDCEFYFLWYPLITADKSEYTATVEWNTASSQTFKVVIGESVTLESAPVEPIAATVDYNAVWNETRGTWYIKVSVPEESLDVDSVTSINVIKEAGEELTAPRTLTPDTDKVLWFGVAKGDGDTSLKTAGEYAYEVVRKDGTKYIFNFTYVPGSVTGATNLVTSALSAVNTAADRDALKVVIEENAVTLGLDLTEYNKLIDDRKPSVSSDLLSNKPKEGYDLAKLQEYFNAIVATRLVTQDSMNKANNATTATELEGYVSMLLERFQAASGVYTFHSGEALTDKVTLLSGLMERYNKLDETGQTAVLEKVLVLRTSKYGGEFARSRYTTDAFKTALEAVEGELGTEQGTNIQMMQFAPIINAEEPLEIEAETEVTTEEATESDEVTTDEAVAEEVNEEEITDETAVETDETQLEGEEEVVVETAGAEDIIEEI